MLSQRKWVSLLDLRRRPAKALACRLSLQYPLGTMQQNLWLTLVTCRPYVLGEFLQYSHHERIHQGLNKIIEQQHQQVKHT